MSAPTAVQACPRGASWCVDHVDDACQTEIVSFDTGHRDEGQISLVNDPDEGGHFIILDAGYKFTVRGAARLIILLTGFLEMASVERVERDGGLVYNKR
jgi:hypothetical protein